MSDPLWVLPDGSRTAPENLRSRSGSSPFLYLLASGVAVSPVNSCGFVLGLGWWRVWQRMPPVLPHGLSYRTYVVSCPRLQG
jgi:hypothetical protein